jgi:hypothetical protein
VRVCAGLNLVCGIVPSRKPVRRLCERIGGVRKPFLGTSPKDTTHLLGSVDDSCGSAVAGFFNCGYLAHVRFFECVWLPHFPACGRIQFSVEPIGGLCQVPLVCRPFPKNAPPPVIKYRHASAVIATNALLNGPAVLAVKAGVMVAEEGPALLKRALRHQPHLPAGGARSELKSTSAFWAT